ncbi:MAG TPA: ATP-binding protein [Polyangiaceae bacterium]|nr:ATP-binding protein [Polyangiaceae bacterium]
MAGSSWRSLRAPVWLGLLSGGAFAAGAALQGQPAWLLGAGVLLAAAAGASAGALLRLQASHPLRTAANVLDALRRGDYTHRARTDVVHGAVADLLGEINHLAEHLQAERARAEETAALLQALVERVDVALLTFDDRQLLRWWNPAAERLFSAKLRADASAGELGARELLSGASERSVGLSGHDPSAVWELRRGVFHRAGQRYQFLLLSSAQRMRREEERAAWQRLVRVLGHEVNNTLAPIQSLAATCRSMLSDGEAALPELGAALQVMEHRAASLAHFISEFARLARLPEPRLEPLELAEQLRRVASLDARCPVRVLGKVPVQVLADGPMLEQALVNLIRNAVDASVPRQGEVTIDWSVDAASVVLSIVDEGNGISNPDNLFVPLFSTKPGGSGIGLVLARNIVEAHGGQLRLDNRQRARGCVARVTLPRWQAAGSC